MFCHCFYRHPLLLLTNSVNLVRIWSIRSIDWVFDSWVNCLNLAQANMVLFNSPHDCQHRHRLKKISNNLVLPPPPYKIASFNDRKHRFSDNTNKKEPAVPQVPQAAEVAPVAAEVTPVAAVAAAANQTQTLEALNSFSLPSGNEIFNSSVRPTRWATQSFSSLRAGS